MKRITFTALVCLLSSVLCPQSSSAEGVIRRLVWQVETSDPVPRNWSLTYGETVDFEVGYLDHRKAMDISGSAIVLHCRTNGMAADYSFQATGSVYTAAGPGYARVRVAVSTLLPTNLTSATYVLSATQGGTTNLLTATGTFRLSGTGAGIYNAPLPAPIAAALSARIDALTSSVLSVSSVLSNTAAQAESNRLAIAAIPPPSTDALRLITPAGTEWRDATGAVWRISAVTAAWTVVIPFPNITFSITNLPPPALWTTYPQPDNYSFSAFDYELQISCQGDNHSFVLVSGSGDYYATGGINVSGSETDGHPVTNITLYSTHELPDAYLIYNYAGVMTSRVDTVALMSDINRATNSLASASSVASFSQSVVSVQSVLNSNQWITINSVPASASRIMVAPGILQTTDTNGIVDLWRLIPARIWSVYSASGLYDGSSSQMYRIDPGSTIALPSYMQFPSKSELFFETGPIYFDFNGTQVDMGYWGFTGTGDETSFTVSSIQPEFYTGTADFSSVVIPNVFYATNHIARLASTNDVNAQIAAYLVGAGYTSTNDVAAAIAAWMQSNEAGQWVAGAASSAAQSAVANHTNSPTHLITGDRALIDSISGKVSIADKEFHADSFTNLVWRTVYSNGWVWLQAYTNTP